MSTILSILDGIVSAWHFEGNGTPTVGSITLVPQAALAYGAGKFNQGIVCNGTTNSFMQQTTNGSPVSGSGDFTVSFYLKRASNPPAPEGCIGFGTDPNTVFLDFWADGKFYFHVYGDSGFVISNSVVCDGTWHYITCRKRSNVWQIFVDGLPDGTPLSQAFTVGTGRISVGSVYSGGARLNGSIDELIFWNRGLSDGEILATYLAGEYPYKNKNLFFTGANSSNFEDPLNWSLTDGGASIGIVPSGPMCAVFTNLSPSCTLSSDVKVNCVSFKNYDSPKNLTLNGELTIDRLGYNALYNEVTDVFDNVANTGGQFSILGSSYLKLTNSISTNENSIDIPNLYSQSTSLTSNNPSLLINVYSLLRIKTKTQIALSVTLRNNCQGIGYRGSKITGTLTLLNTSTMKFIRDLFFRNTGNTNLSLDTNWSLTDGGPANATTPTIEDAINFTVNSGNMTVDIANVTCTAIIFNGYANSITYNNKISIDATYVENIDFALFTVGATAALGSNKAIRILPIGINVKIAGSPVTSLSPDIELGANTYAFYTSNVSLGTAALFTKVILFGDTTITAPLGSNDFLSTLTLDISSYTVVFNTNLTLNIQFILGSGKMLLNNTNFGFAVGGGGLDFRGASVIVVGQMNCTSNQFFLGANSDFSNMILSIPTGSPNVYGADNYIGEYLATSTFSLVLSGNLYIGKLTMVVATLGITSNPLNTFSLFIRGDVVAAGGNTLNPNSCSLVFIGTGVIPSIILSGTAGKYIFELGSQYEIKTSVIISPDSASSIILKTPVKTVKGFVIFLNSSCTILGAKYIKASYVRLLQNATFVMDGFFTSTHQMPCLCFSSSATVRYNITYIGKSTFFSSETNIVGANISPAGSICMSSFGLYQRKIPTLTQPVVGVVQRPQLTSIGLLIGNVGLEGVPSARLDESTNGISSASFSGIPQ